MIHKTAIIEDGAIIGENVSIGAYSIINKDVKVGNRTIIGNNSSIFGRTTIGENNKIYSNCILGSEPQDLKYGGEDSELIVGDNNTFREFCSINKGTKGGGNKSIIGNNNLIMSHVHLGHDCILNNNIIIVSGCVLGGHIEIGSNTIIGGGSGIHQFVKIGEYSMLAGGSILTQDLPPYCMAQGNTAHLRGLNITGLRRKLKDEVNPLKKAYKEIFTNTALYRENARNILKTDDNEYVKKLAYFVVNTERGIHRKMSRNMT